MCGMAPVIETQGYEFSDYLSAESKDTADKLYVNCLSIHYRDRLQLPERGADDQ